MIASERTVGASPEAVHDLLTDVAAWRLWSPHISWTDPTDGHVAAGWRGQVKAWFSPVPTEMHVTWAQPGQGMKWETTGLGHTLRYEQRIDPAPEGSHVRFSARLEGPAGAVLTRIAEPLSALGQRRRLARLATLAEYQARSSRSSR